MKDEAANLETVPKQTKHETHDLHTKTTEFG